MSPSISRHDGLTSSSAGVVTQWQHALRSQRPGRSVKWRRCTPPDAAVPSRLPIELRRREGIVTGWRAGIVTGQKGEAITGRRKQTITGHRVELMERHLDSGRILDLMDLAGRPLDLLDRHRRLNRTERLPDRAEGYRPGIVEDVRTAKRGVWL